MNEYNPNTILTNEVCVIDTEAIHSKGYNRVSDIIKEIFEKLYANVKFDGHTVAVWKNDLVEIAKEYGVILE